MIPPIHLINKECRLGITEETGSYLAQSKFVNTKKQEPMNTQLINQIKAIQGVKEVTLVNDMAVVVFEPRKPIYTDPEDGTEFFDGDVYLYFDKYTCEVVDGTISNLTFKQEDGTSSKIFKSRQLCELALAKFITDKYK